MTMKGHAMNGYTVSFHSTCLSVAGAKHAEEWKLDEHLIALADGEAAAAKVAAESLGLTGVKPIGKWSYQANASTHWVVEELRPGLVLVVR